MRFAVLPFTWLLLSAAAHAAPNCFALEAVTDKVTSCEKNKFFLDAANTCLAEFEARIRQAQAELAGGLVAPMDHKQDAAKVGRQTQGFEHNSGNQRLSAEKLAALRAWGLSSREEINQYMRGLVIAFTTQGQTPDIDAPGAIDYFSRDACYGEPRRAIEGVLTRADTHLADLARTQAASLGLKGTSDQKQASLGEGEAGGRQVAAVLGSGGGHSENGASDVTGLKEDSAKRVSFEPTGTPSQVSAALATNAPSSITAAAPPQPARPSWSSRIAPSGIFSARGALGPGAGGGAYAAPPRPERPGYGNSSVGEALWGRPEELYVKEELALSKRTSSAAAVEAVAGLARAPASENAPAPAPDPSLTSAAVAPAERNLFQLVSARYRRVSAGLLQ